NARLYATIYNPEPGDPASRDEEAWEIWAEKFRAAGLDPAVHIVNGNKKDNFWMMGETGPCGPCSELHVDLTPSGDTGGALVNKGSADCIEIWNLVFIQFNANPDGSFSPLPARHVDTGMGFERVTSIIQGTKNLTDFANARISNYETDIFRPIFDEIEKLSGRTYGSTLPASGSTGDTEQEKTDVAFRVIADHIRTLTFAIGDGIQPGNTDRNYVLRRILRRAVRYGRSLGFRSPFFHKLVDVLARTMGDVFPEIRSKQKHIEDVLKLEEETFNKTLDKGITLFNEEVARITTVPGSAPAPGASAGAPAGVRYTKRHLPHFERPWAKYMVTFSTSQNRHLTAAERDIVMASIRYGHDHAHYELYAACVMPDHVHLLLEPQIKSETNEGETVFYSLTEILQAIKSTTAHRINKAANVTGVHVWEEESFDRLIRGDADLQEKFEYICRNPWDAKIQLPDGTYPWLWTSEHDAVSREGAENSARGGRAPRDLSQPSQSQLSAAFAFKLYDEQGFPLDLTELMARERGLTVDTEGFNTLMEAQRARARAAQKKQVITLSEIETTTPTVFTGYDSLTDTARVLEVLTIKDRTAVILDRTPCYAEMGGQVGDTAEITRGGQLWRVANTQKTGNTWLHLLDSADAPNVGDEVQVTVNAARRAAIQRHHTVTHLLHWA
ncbi:MAG: alanine--tRNA ligase-related protein, partial [Spartobacteria bacterium]